MFSIQNVVSIPATRLVHLKLLTTLQSSCSSVTCLRSKYFPLNGAHQKVLVPQQTMWININKSYVIFERNGTGESQRDMRGSRITLFKSLPWYNSGPPFLTLRSFGTISLSSTYSSHPTHSYVRVLFPHSSEHADGCLCALFSLLHVLEKRKYCNGRKGLFLDFDSQFMLQVVHFWVKKIVYQTPSVSPVLESE